MRIRPDQTLRAQVPFGDSYESRVVFELRAERSGALAIEVRSLDFAPRLKVSRIREDGALTPMGEVQWGELGPRSFLLVEVQAGARYRIEVQPLDFPHCGPEFELSVASKLIEPIEAGAREAAYRFYLAAVRTKAEKSGKLECRLHALGLEAEMLMVGGEYKQAMLVAEEALALSESRFGSDHIIALGWLDRRVLLLFYMGAYGESKPLAERYLAMIEKRLGPDHPYVADALNRLAWILMRLLSYAEAKPLVERALAIGEKRFGPDHPNIVNSLNSLAPVVGALGSQAEAVAYYERALAIDEKNLGPDHEYVGVLLSNLAQSFISMGKYSDARPLLERSIAINEKKLGPDHPDLAFPLEKLGGVLENLDHLAEARAVHERALAIREKKLGAEHPLVSSSLRNLAALLQSMGLFGESRALYEKALVIGEKQYGPADPRVAYILADLGSLLDEMGLYAEARPLFDRALGIIEEKYGPRTWRAARILDGIGLLLWRTGSYAESKKVLEGALALNEEKYGPDSGGVAMNLNDLALVLRDMGSYADAKRLFERALAINEKQHGPETRVVALNLDNLASVLHRMGSYAEAKSLLERALAIREKVEGPEHPRVAWIVSKLGRVHQSMGSYTEAKTLYGRALRINEKMLGPEHPQVAYLLRDMAGILHTLGSHTEARALYERSLVIAEKQLGPEHPALAEILNKYGELLAGMGERAAALNAALRAEQVGRDHLLLTGRTLAEGQALRYASVRVSGLDLALSIAAQSVEGIPESSRRVWGALTRSRALVLDEMAGRNRTVAQAARITRIADKVGAASSNLANLLVRGPGKEPPGEYRRLVDDAREQKRLAEEALAAVSSTFGEQLARQQLGWDTIVENLPSDSALVSYVLYQRRPLSPSTAGTGAFSGTGESVSSYLAFVLSGGGRNPVVVPLGSTNEIDALVSAWQEKAGSPREPEAAYRTAAERLRRSVWDPVAAHLGRTKRVFVVLDGALNLVSLATLPVGEGGYLIENGPTIHYLSAERDLVPSRVEVPKNEGLLALGDPAFDDAGLFAGSSVRTPGVGTAGSSESESMTMASILAKVVTVLPFRGDRSACGDFQSMRFEPLPASEREVREIVGLWKKGKDEKFASLTRVEASETAFKARAPGHRVLHLATHGFFLGGRCRSVLGSPRGIGGLVGEEQKAPPPVTGDNPLLLSGLVLAGANHRGVAAPDQDDGILTAEEIAAMDLSGVEWAVLSACDTGVGEVKAGEGVFGLRRAFQVAGAGTLIMSLWSVQDEPAREWMRALYEGHLAKGLGTAEAVRAASLTVLRDRRTGGQSGHPFYWGAFVAAGDWK